MTKTDIKKRLYKEKPEAHLTYIRAGSAYYTAKLGELNLNFKIPVSDMGDADFLAVMEAKYLIRWLQF